MSRHAAILAALTIGLVCLPAEAADRTVRFSVPPQIAANLPSMPQISEPKDEAETEINRALRRLDAKVRKATDECNGFARGKGYTWERTIHTTMRGPRFLSFSVVDFVDCRGAHPSIGTFSIVYDLVSGAPVDWTTLLPPSLTGKVALYSQLDGSKIVTLESKRLHALYLERYRPEVGDRDDPNHFCREVVRRESYEEPPTMMVWLDAKQRGLSVQFDLPHVSQACSAAVIIPVDVLRREGAATVLTDAIDAAHAEAAKP